MAASRNKVLAWDPNSLTKIIIRMFLSDWSIFQMCTEKATYFSDIRRECCWRQIWGSCINCKLVKTWSGILKRVCKTKKFRYTVSPMLMKCCVSFFFFFGGGRRMLISLGQYKKKNVHNLWESDFWTVKPVFRSLDGQKLNHQIYLKILDMIFLAINCSLVKKNS